MVQRDKDNSTYIYIYREGDHTQLAKTTLLGKFNTSFVL